MWLFSCSMSISSDYPSKINYSQGSYSSKMTSLLDSWMFICSSLKSENFGIWVYLRISLVPPYLTNSCVDSRKPASISWMLAWYSCNNCVFSSPTLFAFMSSSILLFYSNKRLEACSIIEMEFSNYFILGWSKLFMTSFKFSTQKSLTFLSEPKRPI